MTAEASYPVRASAEVSHLVPVSPQNDLAKKRTNVRKRKKGNDDPASGCDDKDATQQDHPTVSPDDADKHEIDFLV